MSNATNVNGRNLPAVINPDQIDYGPGSHPVVKYTLGDMREIAETAAKSRMFPMDASQIMTLMLICEAEGLHPVQAMRRFHIIEGRPAMRADAMQAEFQRHGGRIRWIRSTAEICEAEFTHPRYQPEPFTVCVTLQELVDSGVAMGKWDERERKRKLKDNYQKFPRSMLRARVISEGVRAVDPGVVAGIYTPEEVEDMRAVPVEATVVEEPRASLRAAIDAARRPAIEPAAAVPQAAPPRTAFGEWLDARIADAHARWSGIARGAGLDPGRPITRQQVANHLVKSWIAAGTLHEQDIQSDGRRDRNKVALVISSAWEEDPAEVAADVDEYLGADVMDRAAEAGIGVAGATGPDVEPSDAGGAEAPEADADEAWEPGRE